MAEWQTRVWSIRSALGLTQEELGERLGVSSGAVSHWENGRARPSSHYLKILSEIEADLLRADAEKLEQVRRFCSECVAQDPQGKVAIALMREVYLNWCEGKGLKAIAWRNFERYLTQLGFKSDTISQPGSAMYRRGWIGVTVKVGLNSTQAETELDPPPEEPPAGPGPQYAPKDGKLSSVPHVPEDAEVQPQVRLHERLRSKVDALVATLGNAGNQFAELMRAADEYALLLKEPTEKLDVVGLWSVGGSLHELLTAYREQSDGTLAPPLEPQMVAALASVVRDHGAFVLGFEEGRGLVERADQFALRGELISEIAESGTELLEELATNEQLVEEETRKIHATIRDTLHVTGWQASRTTFAGYLAVRNAFRAIIKYSIGSDPNAGAILGLLTGSSVLLGDANCEFIRAAIPVLQQHATQLLVFFKHSPEFRAYVEWALDALEHDHIASGGE